MHLQAQGPLPGMVSESRISASSSANGPTEQATQDQWSRMDEMTEPKPSRNEKEVLGCGV